MNLKKARFLLTLADIQSMIDTVKAGGQTVEEFLKEKPQLAPDWLQTSNNKNNKG